jgi:hypothetical protein
MAIKMMPIVGVITNKNEIMEPCYIKFAVVCDDTLVWCVAFGSTALSIAGIEEKNAKVFIEDWQMTKKVINSKEHYNFVVNKCKIIGRVN